MAANRERRPFPGTYLGVGEEEAILAGDLLAYLWKAGKPIEAEDILIAATAIVKGLTVVTNNLDHFRRIPNLRVEDWLASEVR